MADPSLGDSLAETLVRLTDLIIAMDDGPERDSLRRQHKQVTRQLQALIDKTVDAKTAEYQAATAALGEAIDALKKAQRDVERVAEVITKLAKVISAVAKVAAMA